MCLNPVALAVCIILVAGFSSPLVLAAPGAAPDQAGRVAKRQKMLEKFDTNGNGQFDPDERQAARKAIQDRRERRGGQGRGGAGTDPERRRKVIERFDRDGDGKLSDAERAAAREARAKRER